MLEKLLGQLASHGNVGAEDDLSNLQNLSLDEVAALLSNKYGITYKDEYGDAKCQTIKITYNFSFESQGELACEYEEGTKVWRHGYCFKYYSQPNPHWEFDEQSTINGQ